METLRDWQSLDGLARRNGPTRWGNQLNGNGFRALLVLVWPPGPTRWGNQLNGNTNNLRARPPKILSGPTRWGNQLNGNSDNFCICVPNRGGPTRWGNQLNGNLNAKLGRTEGVGASRPHSLGQSVEWKQATTTPDPLCAFLAQGPTRWGNQLNGNP